MHISTVRITSAETVSGFIVINEADFDPSKHQIWNSEVTVATPEPSSAEPNANKSLDLMTLAELRDHAKAHGIAIPATITAKADVLAHVLRFRQRLRRRRNRPAAGVTISPQREPLWLVEPRKRSAGQVALILRFDRAGESSGPCPEPRTEERDKMENGQHAVEPGVVEIYVGQSKSGIPQPVKKLLINGESIPFLGDSDFILRVRGGGPAEIQCSLYAERFASAPWSKK